MTDTPSKTYSVPGIVRETSPHRLITGFNPNAQKAPKPRLKADRAPKGPNGVPLITVYPGQG